MTTKNKPTAPIRLGTAGDLFFNYREKDIMRKIILANIDGKSLYQGVHDSLNDAIEYAILNHIPLDSIDLSGAILNHINLDGVTLHGASFKGADLTGANMSEANFSNCDFSNAVMDGTCLCYSNINHCNLRLSTFLGCDIAMSSLINCEFEGFSTYHLNFQSTFKLDKLSYYHFEKSYPFDACPIVIKSGHNTLALLGNIVIIKDILHTLECNKLVQPTLQSLTRKIQSLVDSI